MTRDDIIRMAREAHGELLASGKGMYVWHGDAYAGDVQDFCERFAGLVAAAEREACAKACEDQRDLREEARAALRAAAALKEGDEDTMLRALRHDSDVRLYHCGLDKAAAAIRARSERQSG